jgi:hypothetical protein
VRNHASGIAIFGQALDKRFLLNQISAAHTMTSPAKMDFVAFNPRFSCVQQRFTSLSRCPKAIEARARRGEV